MTTNIQGLDPNATKAIEDMLNPENLEVIVGDSTPNKPTGEEAFPPSTPEDLMRIPEVKGLVEAARTQEKAKLYKTLASRDAKIKELGDKVEELEGVISLKDNENLQEVGLMQKEITNLKGMVEQLMRDAQAEREAAEKKQKEAQLEAYKERRLRELRDNGENVILALIKGDSEEELEASIETAKEEYQKIFEEAVQSTSKQNNQEPRQNSNLPRVTNPPAGSTALFNSKDVKKMQMNDYGKNREKLLKLAGEGKLTE